MTAKDPMYSVQKALIAALRDDATLMSMVSGIYDWVTEGSPFPFVTLGDATETPDNLLGREGRTLTYTFHVWSQEAGYSEALKVKAELVRVLTSAPLVSPDFAIWRCVFESSHTLRDPDGLTRHVPVVFRIDLQF